MNDQEIQAIAAALQGRLAAGPPNGTAAPAAAWGRPAGFGLSNGAAPTGVLLPITVQTPTGGEVAAYLLFGPQAASDPQAILAAAEPLAQAGILRVREQRGWGGGNGGGFRGGYGGGGGGGYGGGGYGGGNGFRGGYRGYGRRW
jgi:hypothetical protein